MREFSYKERKFIVEHQDTASLGSIARKLNCDWHEVYNCFDELTRTKAYRDYMDKRKESISNGECFGKQIEYVEGQEGENRKSDSNELSSAPSSNDCRVSDNANYFKYGRLN